LWERAKQHAEALGISRAALFPTLTAVASASVNQYSLFNGKFNHENTTLFPASLNLTYTVFDFGARNSRIDAAKANLLAADFAFNNTHRSVAFHVAESYYRVLDTISREESARAALADAQTVREAVETRLSSGLATLPDALQARAAAAEAQYELASEEGSLETAHGDLATVLGVSPTSSFRVQEEPSVPALDEETVQAILDRALKQRPDLLAQLAHLKSTEAAIQQAHSAFDPTFSFSGSWGHNYAIGQQKGGPELHSQIYPYQAQFTLAWTVFDGNARTHEVRRAQAESEEARQQAASTRNQIENEIWASYSRLKTARQQMDAAEALLAAADQSYSSAFEAFQAGVRTFIDVSSAQKTLAQARSRQVAARIRVLMSTADLAYRAADPIPGGSHL
jgi:outer membrane protein TolC